MSLSQTAHPVPEQAEQVLVEAFQYCPEMQLQSLGPSVAPQAVQLLPTSLNPAVQAVQIVAPPLQALHPVPVHEEQVAVAPVPTR